MLMQVTQREKAIRSRPDFAQQASEAAIAMATGGGSGGAAAGGGFDSIDGKGRDLSHAIESLPELLARKTNLEAHTSVLQAVMRKIALREIPTYFELEQGILSNGGKVADRTAVVGLLKDGSKGLLEDKARLLLLVATCGDSAMNGKASTDELDAAFVVGCEAIGKNPPSKEAVEHALAAVRFMRRLQSLQTGGGMRSGFGGGGGAFGAGGGAGAGGSNALLSSFLTSAHSRASSLMAKATSFFSKFTPYYATRMVNNLAEGRSCPEDDTFLYLDPRSRDGSSSSSGGGAGSGHKYSDVIVFALGGGNYAEFCNLQDLIKDKAASGSANTIRSITYGCTDVLSGDAFIDQLKRLSGPVPTAAATTASAPASASGAK
jgi:sec1 family domain-containing protein 1